MLVVFPGCFCILSLFLAVVAMASSEWEEASIAEAKQKEGEFRQILQVLKTREEEEVRSFHQLHVNECHKQTNHLDITSNTYFTFNFF